MDDYGAAVTLWAVLAVEKGSRLNEVCPVTKRSTSGVNGQRVEVKGHCYDREETTEQVLSQVLMRDND